MISNLFFEKNAANCIQSRAMFDAFKESFDVEKIFRDNSSLAYRVLRVLTSRFREEIVFTRSFSIALLCRIIRARCIYELHELHASRNYKLLVGKSPLSILCISASLKNKFIERVGTFDVDVFVRHDGCDTRMINDLKLNTCKKPNVDLTKFTQGKKILLHTGSTYKIDGYRFSEILDKLPENWIFIQLGDVDTTITRQYSTDKIVFLPRCQHRDAIYAQQQADCLLYLNFPESRMFEFTSPLKFFEYIVSGKPFISTVGGATDEILLMLSEYGTYDDMKNYLRLISSGQKDAAFSDQADRLEEEISWTTRATFIVNRYLGSDVASRGIG